MKNFYLLLNNTKEGVVEYADNIERVLHEKNLHCARNVGYIDPEKLPKNIDCIISLGGDGTIIKAARDVAGLNIPILGINMGNLGYLTGAKKEDNIENIVNSLINNDFKIEKRMLLNGYAIKKGVKTKKYLALNDICINRVLTGKTIKCSVSVNGKYLNEYNSDGIIISTPTGSTAYNLSAGRPIVEPTAKLMIITPICPHTLNLRSLVLSPSSTIDIEIIGDESVERVAVFDGENTIKLEKNDHIIIKESKIKVYLIKLGGLEFLDNLRNKMRCL